MTVVTYFCGLVSRLDHCWSVRVPGGWLGVDGDLTPPRLYYAGRRWSWSVPR